MSLDGWAGFYTIGADRVPVPCFDVIEWGTWHANNLAACRIGDDRTEHYRVSTVFLALDHNHFRQDDPILFETMVFFTDGDYGAMERYRTWAEAQAGHERIRSMLEREYADAHQLTLDTLRALLTVPRTSRNAREGRYGFKHGGRHWRTRVPGTA
jgi:hypothetical protein